MGYKAICQVAVSSHLTIAMINWRLIYLNQFIFFRTKA